MLVTVPTLVEFLRGIRSESESVGPAVPVATGAEKSAAPRGY